MPVDNIKCPKCRKAFLANQNSSCCDSYNNWFHLRCSKISLKVFKKMCFDNNINFVCYYCVNYKCGKCSLPVFDFKNALCFDNSECTTWFHLKCTNISLPTYNTISANPNSNFWFCQNCYVFPFTCIPDKDFIQISTAEHT